MNIDGCMLLNIYLYQNIICNFLEIRDGDTRNSSLIGTFCGDPSRTPGKPLFIHLHWT